MNDAKHDDKTKHKKRAELLALAKHPSYRSIFQALLNAKGMAVTNVYQLYHRKFALNPSFKKNVRFGQFQELFRSLTSIRIGVYNSSKYKFVWLYPMHIVSQIALGGDIELRMTDSLDANQILALLPDNTSFTQKEIQSVVQLGADIKTPTFEFAFPLRTNFVVSCSLPVDITLQECAALAHSIRSIRSASGDISGGPREGDRIIGPKGQ
jgi:hypothetical protein